MSTPAAEEILNLVLADFEFKGKYFDRKALQGQGRYWLVFEALIDNPLDENEKDFVCSQIFEKTGCFSKWCSNPTEIMISFPETTF